MSLLDGKSFSTSVKVCGPHQTKTTITGGKIIIIIINHTHDEKCILKVAFVVFGLNSCKRQYLQKIPIAPNTPLRLYFILCFDKQSKHV